MEFSEPVIKQTVEDNFEVISEFLNDMKQNSIFTKNNFTFNWNDDEKSVLIKLNSPLQKKNNSNETKYLIKWKEPYKDKNGKSALRKNASKLASTGFFRFGGYIIDFLTFSIKGN